MAMSEQQLSQQIENLQIQISRLQQMASLGELVGTTTHEFNNYLMTIINYAKIGMRHKDDESRDRAFQKIHDAGIKAAEITKVILGSARNRSDKLEPTDLKVIVEQAILLLEREMRKYRINLETQLESVPAVMANGNQIQQVLINLLVNARQALDIGGQINVSLHHPKDSSVVELQVKDNGQGMPREVLTRIFDPQFSTKSGPDETGKGGTGFGLYNCRQIIEAHRGKIRVESSPGNGTCFTIMLNKAPQSPATVTENTQLNSSMSSTQ